MKALATFAAACLVGCNAVLGLDAREHSASADVASAPDAPHLDVGATDGSVVDTSTVDTSTVDAPTSTDGGAIDTSMDTAKPDVPVTWCDTEPAHAYCEDFDKGHVLAFLEMGGGKAALGVPAKTLPLALGCAIPAASAASSALLQIPVSKSSKLPGIAFDVMFDPVDLAAAGDVDVVQLLFLTTSFRLSYQKPGGMPATLKIILDFGGGATGSIGIGTVSTGWNRVSMRIEGDPGSQKLVARINDKLGGAAGAGSLADSGGLYQIQKLVLGPSAPIDGKVPLSVHFDDVTLDL